MSYNDKGKARLEIADGNKFTVIKVTAAGDKSLKRRRLLSNMLKTSTGKVAVAMPPHISTTSTIPTTLLSSTSRPAGKKVVVYCELLKVLALNDESWAS
jgi:hypothetical protein